MGQRAACYQSDSTGYCGHHSTLFASGNSACRALFGLDLSREVGTVVETADYLHLFRGNQPVGGLSPLHPVSHRQIHLLQAARTEFIPRPLAGFLLFPYTGLWDSPAGLSSVPAPLAVRLSVPVSAVPHVPAQPNSLLLTHVTAYAQDPSPIRALSPPRSGPVLRKGLGSAHRPHLLLLRRYLPQATSFPRNSSFPHSQTSVLSTQ